MSSGGDIVAGPAVEASADLLEPHMKSTYRSYKYDCLEDLFHLCKVANKSQEEVSKDEIYV